MPNPQVLERSLPGAGGGGYVSEMVGLTILARGRWLSPARRFGRQGGTGRPSSRPDVAAFVFEEALHGRQQWRVLIGLLVVGEAFAVIAEDALSDVGAPDVAAAVLADGVDVVAFLVVDRGHPSDCLPVVNTDATIVVDVSSVASTIK